MTVKFRVGREQLVAVLTDVIWLGEPVPATKPELLERVRQALKYHGVACTAHSDDGLNEDGTLVTAAQVANTLVDEFFPELKTQPTCEDAKVGS